MERNINWGYILRILIPLFLGGIIYWLYGDTNIYLVSFLDSFPFLAQVRAFCQASYQIPQWIVFNLPDGLWLFSLIQTLQWIWKEDKNREIWLCLPIFIAALHEFGQHQEWFNGTFDPLDLLSYTLAALIAVIWK